MSPGAAEIWFKEAVPFCEVIGVSSRTSPSAVQPQGAKKFGLRYETV